MTQGGNSLAGLAVVAACCGLPVLLMAADVLNVSAWGKALAVGALLVGALGVLVAAGRRRHA